MYDLVITSLPGMDRDKPAPGPAFLKGYLETKGFKIKVIDGNQLDTLDNIHKEISQYKFKWLGISVFSYLQKDDALKLGEKYDNVLFGGSGVDVFWPRKHFVVGEGEYALVEFLNGNLDYPGINGKPPQQIENIEDLPPPDYSDVMCKHDYDTAIISGSRGCVRKCTFCDIENIWPKFRYRSAESLIDEIKKHHEMHGVTRFDFTDSLINGSVSNFYRFNTLLAEAKAKDSALKEIKYLGQAICRPRHQMPETHYEAMYYAGCQQLTIGIESFSNDVRNHMKKKFSDRDIEYHLEQCKYWNIPNIFLMITGYPTETIKDHEKNLQDREKYKDYAKIGIIEMIRWGTTMHLIPDTPITNPKYVKELGLKGRDHRPIGFDPSSQYYWHSTKNPDLTLRERIRRRIELHQHSVRLGYPQPRVQNELTSVLGMAKLLHRK